MEEAIRADRVVVMDAGKIALEGSPASIFSQVARIRDLGLDVPVAAEIAMHLRHQGVDLPGEIITDAQLVGALCR
jgi:energy-coupling factor transport system ATP-binding protein